MQRDWKALWKENRRLIGIRCKSLEESKKISFRIKCISNSLPVLNVLKKRAPDLYESDECKECHLGQETSVHLLCCEEYSGYWNNIEELACWLVWRKLDKADRSKITKVDLSKILVGETEAEKIRHQELCIQGLSTESMFKELYTKQLS